MSSRSAYLDALDALVARLRAAGVQCFDGPVEDTPTYQGEAPTVKLVLFPQAPTPERPQPAREPKPERPLTPEEREDELDRRVSRHSVIHGGDRRRTGA